MIELCGDKISRDIKIWRYMNLAKFMDLIINKKLFFCRTNNFKDGFEATPYGIINRMQYIYDFGIEMSKFMNKKGLTEDLDMKNSLKNSLKNAKNTVLKMKESYIVSCWHINTDYSEAMWKIYCPNNDGVAIETSVGKVLGELENNPGHIYYGKVQYLENPDDRSPEKIIFNKRPYFTYEKEFRLAVVNKEVNEYPNGKSVDVDLNRLIKNIHVAPEAPVWIKNLIEQIVKKEGINKPVLQENIYKFSKDDNNVPK